MTDKNDLNGLGGWLILVGIGLVISPIRLTVVYYPIFSQIFTDGTWEILTTPGSAAYSPLWAPLLTAEIIYNGSMILLSIYLIFLFSTKHYLFPKIYIVMTVISLVFVPADAWLSTFVLPSEPMFDPETIKEIVRAFVGAAIWVPYMIVSKRVKLLLLIHRLTRCSRRSYRLLVRRKAAPLSAASNVGDYDA